MNPQTRLEIRFGLTALAISGLMFAVGIILRGPVSLSDPGACCRAPVSGAHVAGWTSILVGLVADLYGFLGLYRYLTSESESRMAFWALVLIVPGIGLLFPLAALFAVLAPAIADLYQRGSQDAIGIVQANFTSPLGVAVLAVQTVTVIAGAILFAIAVWRDGRLPKWTAVFLGLSILLLGFPATFVTELLGAVLLLIGGSAMAWKSYDARLGEPK